MKMPKRLPNIKHQLRKPIPSRQAFIQKRIGESNKGRCHAFGYETCGKRLPLKPDKNCTTYWILHTC